MKRKAPQSLDTDSPAKVTKELTQAEGSETQKSTMDATVAQPTAAAPTTGRRERKAPSWLSSYVTDGSITVKEPPKSAETKGAQPSKKKSAKVPVTQPTGTGVKQENVNDEPPGLRRGSTMKLEDSSVPAVSDTAIKKTNHSAASIAKKSSDVSVLTIGDPGQSSAEYKPDIKSVKSKSKIAKQSSKMSVSSSPSTSSSMQRPKSKTVPKLPNKTSTKRNNSAKSSVHVYGMDANEFNSSNVLEVCDTKSAFAADLNRKVDAGNGNMVAQLTSSAGEKREKPKMLEIVICISTSGAMRDYLTILQDKTREMVWRLQSLIPNLRVGVFAHTQGGIHDDKPGSGSSAIDHNYIRTGGHSGTKWLDLGATFSQICAFVDSLEPEATVYPDYVQDNLEVALWKLQRCMSWSSCSYRTVVMVGRGRPNRTSFYLQREHWRGWIRSALEIGPKAEIPIVDWELEAKFLAQMGIHVFTVQAVSPQTLAEEEEDEGSVFFRRVAEITNGLHIKITSAAKLIDIIVGVCCACHGPDLLQDHRDTLRDENDGVLPQQLKDIFVAFQLHSKRRSLSTIPSLVGDLSALQRQLKEAEANGNISSSGEEEISGDEEEQLADVKMEEVKGEKGEGVQSKTNSTQKNVKKLQNTKSGAKSHSTVNKTSKAAKTNQTQTGKAGGVVKNKKLESVKRKQMVKKVVKTVTKMKEAEKTVNSVAASGTQTQNTNSTNEAKDSVKLNVKTVKPRKAEGVKGGKVEKAKVKVAQAKVMKAKSAANLVPNKVKRMRGRPPGKTAASGKVDVAGKLGLTTRTASDGKSANAAAVSEQNDSKGSTVPPAMPAVTRRTGAQPAAKSTTVSSRAASKSTTNTKTNLPTSRGSRTVDVKRGNNNVKTAKVSASKANDRPPVKTSNRLGQMNTRKMAAATGNPKVSVNTRKSIKTKK